MIGLIRSGRAVLAALFLALTLGVGLMPVHAAPPAQAGATISGQVRSAQGEGLPNVKMAVYTEANTSVNRQPVASFQSGADGRYSVQVPAGTIWVAFLTQDYGGLSYWGYDYTPIAVTAGVNQSNVDFVVALRVVSTPQPAPTATAVPPPPTPLPPAPTPTPYVEPGMPTAGGGATPLWPLLALGGLLLLFGGLRLRARRT
jgi:hypothetical protein